MNRSKGILILAVAYSVACSCYCMAASDQKEWPAHMRENIYLPPSAKDVWAGSSDGLFKVWYRADVCYPAKSLIKAMAAMMKARGWHHLTDDPVNQGVRLPPEYPPSDRSWLGYYPWDSYWTDSNGNVVWYEFYYEVPDKAPLPEYSAEVRRSCSLAVAAVYYTAEVYGKLVQEEKRALEKMLREKGVTTGKGQPGANEGGGQKGTSVSK